MKYWADNGDEGGRPVEIKFSETARPLDTHLPFLCGSPPSGGRRAAGDQPRLLNNLGGAGDHSPQPAAAQVPPNTHDVWRCINLSARECKEDWFPSRTGAEKRGGIEFRPEFTSELVFVIFLTSGAVVGRDALADYIYYVSICVERLYDICVPYYCAVHITVRYTIRHRYLIISVPLINICFCHSLKTITIRLRL